MNWTVSPTQESSTRQMLWSLLVLGAGYLLPRVLPNGSNNGAWWLLLIVLPSLGILWNLVKLRVDVAPECIIVRRFGYLGKEEQLDRRKGGRLEMQESGPYLRLVFVDGTTTKSLGTWLYAGRRVYQGVREMVEYGQSG